MVLIGGIMMLHRAEGNTASSVTVTATTPVQVEVSREEPWLLDHGSGFSLERSQTERGG